MSDMEENNISDNTSTGVNEETVEPKTIHDPIHGSITLDPVLVAIIDTPQFQRLKDIKQLGGCYWVFPGASHNRFEHSIGTSYLCGKMLTTLKSLHDNENNKHTDKEKIEITDEEILCVKIAGLCHDLGHGPFSHMFDKTFIKRAKKGSQWKHEEASCDLFDYMVEENDNVKQIFDEKKINKDMIKDMILGNPKDVPLTADKKHKKQFLYEIVSNKATGIDCDKFDYFTRDAYFVGIKSGFDFDRYFQNVRIMPIKSEEDDGKKSDLRICARDKEESNLYELFHTRWNLHRQVYQHKTVVAVEEMITEALLKVDEKFGLSDSIKNMVKYTYLTDSIFYKILTEDKSDESVKDAQELLGKIQKRELYKFCCEENTSNIRKEKDEEKDEVEECQQIEEEIADIGEIEKGDVFVTKAYFSFGKQKDNPLSEMNFFDKKWNIKPTTSIYEGFRPKEFEAEIIRVYSKKKENIDQVKKAFSTWLEQNKT